jgi:putative intracellular protease/amidase
MYHGIKIAMVLCLFSGMGAIARVEAAPRRVVMVVANPSIATTTGWPVGFWLAELTHPYWEFSKKNYEVVIASPRGGKVEIDDYSDPRGAHGYAAHDILSLGYLHKPDFMEKLGQTVPLAEIAPAEFDALVVAGGQSPMFTFMEDETLQHLVAAFYEQGKVVAALCHGTCILLKTRLASGALLAEGKRITGFANAEEDVADQAVGQKLMPFRIEDEARALGLDFVTGPAFQSFAVRDGRLITGQQQNSGEEVARLVIAALEE